MSGQFRAEIDINQQLAPELAWVSRQPLHCVSVHALVFLCISRERLDYVISIISLCELISG